MQIPSLNTTPAELIAPNTLVRFRCIVGDMFDPECHLATFEEVNTATGARVRLSGIVLHRLGILLAHCRYVCYQTVRSGLFTDALHFQVCLVFSYPC